MLFNYYVFNIITIICFIKTLRITIYPSPSPNHRFYLYLYFNQFSRLKSNPATET